MRGCISLSECLRQPLLQKRRYQYLAMGAQCLCDLPAPFLQPSLADGGLITNLTLDASILRQGVIGTSPCCLFWWGGIPCFKSFTLVAGDSVILLGQRQ